MILFAPATPSPTKEQQRACPAQYSQQSSVKPERRSRSGTRPVGIPPRSKGEQEPSCDLDSSASSVRAALLSRACGNSTIKSLAQVRYTLQAKHYSLTNLIKLLMQWALAQVQKDK